MAVTYNAGNIGWGGSFTDDFTFSLTHTGDLVAVWAFNDRSGADISAITINGTAATLQSSITQASGGWTGRFGYRVAPGTGTINIRVQTSALATKPFAAAVSYSGVDATTPFVTGSLSGVQGNAGTATSATTTAGDSGDMAILMTGYNTSGITISSSTGTLRFSWDFTGAGITAAGDNTPAGGGASTTIAFSHSSADWLGYLGVLKQAAAAGDVITPAGLASLLAFGTGVVTAATSDFTTTGGGPHGYYAPGLVTPSVIRRF